MKNRGITFGSVDSAHAILYLNKGKNLATQQPFPLARSINGTARRPPCGGIWWLITPTGAIPNGAMAMSPWSWRWIGTSAAWLLAEENLDNLPWQNPQAFARQIRLFEVSGLHAAGRAPRAGYFTPYTVAPGVDTVMVSNFDIDRLSHGYLAQAEPLLQDNHDLMLHREPQVRRQLIMPAVHQITSFWKLRR